MTTPTIDTGVPPTTQPRATSFMDWFQVNSRWVGIGAIVVAVAGVIAWYVPHQRALASQNADRMLLDAKRSLNSGNSQLAESDLKKVADRYAGTPSGVEAGILIGQLHLEKGDAPGAVTWLQGLVSKLGTSPSSVQARALLGDALSQSGKLAEAGAEYEAASKATAMPNERTVLQSRSAYAYMAAGKTADAKRLFEILSTQQESQAMANEARVRLGELSVASPAS